MIKASVAGVTGFTGEELLRILLRHPEVTVKHLISRKKGVKIGDVHPSVNFDAETENLSKGIIDDTDVVFLCLPHTESAKIAFKFIEKNIPVIDLSADFRFKNAALYRKAYGAAHPYPSLLSKAVYGLPEFYREKIKNSKIVANPGCYPTAVLLAVIPALSKRLADASGIIVDAKSGLSGAGKKLANEYLFSNVYENTRAYSAARHRHQPEIQQEILMLSGMEPSLTFVPHLIPQKRGIIATVYLRMKVLLKEETIISVYRKFYKKEKFVKVLDKGEQPGTAEVTGTNNARIGIAVDSAAQVLILTAVIDNLIKGASGQAVQNMNLMFGFDEGTAL